MKKSDFLLFFEEKCASWVKTAWETIDSFSKDKRNRLEADMAMIAILHVYINRKVPTLLIEKYPPKKV